MANIAMTAADIVKWVSYGPCNITELHGMNNQATALYIQFHQIPPTSTGTIANGTVPAVKSLQVAANQPFMFTNQTINLSECTIAISSTELNYTAVAANGGLDMTVVTDTMYLVGAGVTVVGDLTTQVSTLQVWAEATAAAQAYRLLRLDAVETANANAGDFIIIYTKDDGGDSNSLVFANTLPLNKTTTLFFGGGGFTPSAPKAGTQTPYIGCTVARSVSASVISVGSHQCAFRAIYDKVV